MSHQPGAGAGAPVPAPPVTEPGYLRKAQRYIVRTLHHGLLALPLLAPAATALAGGALTWWHAVWALGLAAAGASGLVVLHSGVRARGALTPSRWDRWFLRERTAPFVAVWAVMALVSARGFVALVPDFTTTQLAIGVVVCVSAFAAVAAAPLLAVGRRQLPLAPYVATCVLCAAALIDLEPHARRPLWLFTAALWGLLLQGLNSMILTLGSTAVQLDRAHHDTARLAVAEERLRFSRDLHDVFGRTLSTVALKAELAAARADAGRPDAADGMRDVQRIAVDALAEVRGVVRGYRSADLATETAGARALLEAAGCSVSAIVDAADLPGPVGRAFAWVVREASTNILRHAEASHVRIAVTSDAAGARLSVTNDGVGLRGGDERGSGLVGLAERMGEIGGTLEYGVTGSDQFTVTATVDAEAVARLRAVERSQS